MLYRSSNRSSSCVCDSAAARVSATALMHRSVARAALCVAATAAPLISVVRCSDFAKASLFPMITGFICGGAGNPDAAVTTVALAFVVVDVADALLAAAAVIVTAAVFISWVTDKGLSFDSSGANAANDTKMSSTLSFICGLMSGEALAGSIGATIRSFENSPKNIFPSG